MKTSLVVKRYRSGYARACVPDDGPEAWKQTPHFTPKGTHLGTSFNGKPWVAEHDSVTSASCEFAAKRGRVDHIRHAPAKFITELAEIDAEREELHRRLKALNEQEQLLLAAAFANGTPISVAEAANWREIKLAARAAAKAGAK